MNTFGEHFRFTSFGESHGRAVGGVLDGVPAGIQIDMELIRQKLDRRAGRILMGADDSSTHKKSNNNSVSPRALRETDEIEWLSGVIDGVTLGTPIAFIIRNRDARSEDYDWLKETYRIGHADRTYQEKYGIRDHRGGGRASARETASRVVAGAVARQLLANKGIAIQAEVVQVGAETNPELWDAYLTKVRANGDSIGGIVRCTITGVPVGVGEPIFDKLQSHLAFAMMSINGCKGFDYGSGFEHIEKMGSEMYLTGNQQLISGGIAGGISDGSPIIFRCVFKPTASSRKALEAVYEGEVGLKVGRHDACIALRAVPVVEAMAAMTIMDWIEDNQ